MIVLKNGIKHNLSLYLNNTVNKERMKKNSFPPAVPIVATGKQK